MTVKKLLTAIVFSANLCTFFFSTAQDKPVLRVCDASFVRDTTPKAEPAIYPSGYYQYFEAVNKGYESYLWDFGDGSPADSGASVKHHFVSSGTYYVTLSVYSRTLGNLDVVCKDKKGMYVEIKDGTSKPYPGNSLCQAEITHSVKGSELKVTDHRVYYPLVYDGISVKRTWIWGDGTSHEGGQTAEHRYEQAGVYHVTLLKSAYKDPCYQDRVTCYGLPYLLCEEKQTFTVVIESTTGGDPLCDAKVTADVKGSEVAVRDAVVYMPLVYDGTFINRTWDWGDGTTGNGTENETHRYAKPGVYTITLTKTAFKDPCFPNNPYCKALPVKLCEEKYTVSITVADSNNIPECHALLHHKVDGRNVEFSDILVTDYFDKRYVTTLTWDFGDGQSASGQFVKHQYSGPGTYHVKLKKETVYIICPPDENGVACAALPLTICSSVHEVDVTIEGRGTCSADFSLENSGNQVRIKSNNPDMTRYLKLDYGDGEVVETDGSNITSSHTYAKPGVYEICLRVATVSDDILPVVLLPSYCSVKTCQTVTVGGDSFRINGLESESTEGVAVKAFPNPARDVLTFSLSKDVQDAGIRFFNPTGELVKESNKISGREAVIDISDLENGVYVYSLSTKNGVVSKGKVVVTK